MQIRRKSSSNLKSFLTAFHHQDMYFCDFSLLLASATQDVCWARSVRDLHQRPRSAFASSSPAHRGPPTEYSSFEMQAGALLGPARTEGRAGGGHDFAA